MIVCDELGHRQRWLHEHSDHPPYKKESNDCAQDVDHPIAKGSRSSEIKHAGMLAVDGFALRAKMNRSKSNSENRN